VESSVLPVDIAAIVSAASGSICRLRTCRRPRWRVN